jgi:uncharacterized membrane protein YkoI
MNQKFTLVLAASITAFVLVVASALIGRAAQPEAVVSLTPDAVEIQNLYAQREADYQARLDEANAALEAAYSQQEAADISSDPGQFTASPVSATLSPQEAMIIAAFHAPNAQILRLPELVNFQGTVAYEVTLDAGLIYVDANSGVILFDGTAQQQISVQTRSFYDDDEHEYGEDGDD